MLEELRQVVSQAVQNHHLASQRIYRLIESANLAAQALQLLV